MYEKTFLFYDLETSGLNKCFDQVIEFAAIRTDTDLVEISRDHFYLNLTKDTMPSPGAFITHRLSLKKIANGQAENEGVRKIHELMNTPGTISIGYNSLSFDDEFMRFSFAKCLLAPYTHQYLDGCGRADLYPLVVLYYLYQNKALSWPKVDGNVSMKLEHIASTNDWLVGQAHHAMTDVVATLSLARALKKDGDMWNFAMQYFDKASDLSRTKEYCSFATDDLANVTPALLVQGKFGKAANYAVPAICLGIHKHYKNQTIWLRLDNPELTSAVPETASKFIVRNKLAEPPLVLPWKDRFTKVLSSETMANVATNLKFLTANAELFTTVKANALQYIYPEIENIDIDANLYTSKFPARHETEQLNSFHNDLLNNQSTKMLDGIRNKRFHAQALRYLWRFYPELLPAKYANDLTCYSEQIAAENNNIIDFKGAQRLSPHSVLQEIAKLQTGELDQQQLDILAELAVYLQQHFNVTELIPEPSAPPS
jgi:exodeoxyribonuclease I